jgi:hypothetical protein
MGVSDAAFRAHNETQRRLSALETEIAKFGRDVQGNVRVLVGPPGSVSDATNAAIAVMREKFEEQEARLTQAIADLRKQQAEFQQEVFAGQEQFRASVLSELRGYIQQFTMQVLMEAQILDSQGKAHPSLKGATGATGPVGATGPKGDRGETVVGPKGEKGDAGISSHEDLILRVLARIGGTKVGV